jgi:hypothetical protein
VEEIMAETQLALSTEERELLVNLLESSLKRTLVEEHRTRGPTYREHIVQQEELMEGLLRKLGHTVAS